MGGGEGALAIWRMKGKNNTADKFAVFNAQTCFLIYTDTLSAEKNHAIFCSNSLLYKMAIIITIPGFIKLKQHRGKNFKSKNIMEMEVTAFIP